MKKKAIPMTVVAACGVQTRLAASWRKRSHNFDVDAIGCAVKSIPPRRQSIKPANSAAAQDDACKTGEPTTCNFEYSGWLTEANHLGNVAYRVGKKIEWNPTLLKCPNAPEADKFIKREYRKGWNLEKLA